MMLKIILDQHDRGMLWVVGLLVLFAIVSWWEGRRRK